MIAHKMLENVKLYKKQIDFYNIKKT